MEIMFSMKIKKDGKTVQVLMVCTECRGELEMAKGAKKIKFRCRKHGELGTLTAEEFTDGLRQAQERAAQQFGLVKMVRMKVTPTEPTVQ
jgi:LSD1 subclass zinc finger protein